MALLVRFDDNWADEIDVEGFAIYKTREEYDEAMEDFLCEKLEVEKEELRAHLEKVENEDDESEDDDDDFDESFCIYVGSNEDIEYYSISDFKNNFSIDEITDEEYETIAKLIGYRYGSFPLD